MDVDDMRERALKDIEGLKAALANIRTPEARTQCAEFLRLARLGVVVAYPTAELRLAVARAIETADKEPVPDCDEVRMDAEDVSDWGIFLGDSALDAISA